MGSHRQFVKIKSGVIVISRDLYLNYEMELAQPDA